MTIRPTGLLIVLVCNLIPLYWFWQLANEWPGDELAVLSLYFGVAALITMGLIFLLATRAQWLELVFGGLDRIYVLHKWMGIAALALVMLHDSIDSEIDGSTVGWLSELAESLGENSLTMLQVLLAITLIMWVPYHWWRWTHKLMGVLYILAVGHFIWIEKPFFDSSPLALYTYVFCALGVVSYLYTVLPLSLIQKLKGYRRYKVIGLESFVDATAVTLRPTGKGIKHRAGQFAFIRFAAPGLQETHPYTISQGPQESGELRFTIKNLGDYTGGLQHDICEGMQADVQGGFGHFTFRNGKAANIWIAAGIGITPFVACAQQLKPDDKPVHLFYSVKGVDHAPHLEELKKFSESKANFNLHLVDSSQRERLAVDEIIAAVDTGWPKVRVSFCGPKAMRESLKTALIEKGLPASRFHFEEFEIRSGIGLERAIYKLWSKINMRLSGNG